MSEKVCNCANGVNFCVVKSLKGSSVMPATHMHNIDSVSAAEKIIHKNNAVYILDKF